MSFRFAFTSEHAKDGDTALSQAAFTGQKDCMSLLVEAGAALDIQNEVREMTLLLCCRIFAPMYR